MNNFRFTTTRTLISETGSLRSLAEHCRSLGMARPLVVTDQGILASGLLEKLDSALEGSSLQWEHYTHVVADPPESVVLEALQLAREHQADGIIGFGGGSSMDTAKLIALLARSGESLSDIYGVDQVQGKRLPLILIPTTAGTGSEVTPVAVVTTGATTKAGVVSPVLLPDIALLDAELTLGLPPEVTAGTAIDAIVHAIEAYTSVHKKNPYSDLLAREALRLLNDNLLLAVKHGDNLDARQNMLLGACLAGQAFANAPVAAVHALAYPLGGHFHIPHGLSNSLVLPHVMRFNANSAGQLYAELSEMLLPEHADLTTGGRIDALIEHIELMIAHSGLPQRLRDAGVAKDSLAVLAADAMLQQRLLVNNPRTLTQADALMIYQAAY